MKGILIIFLTLVIVAVAVLGIGVFGVYYYQNSLEPVVAKADTVEFVVEPGQTLSGVSGRLENAGLIRSSMVLEIYAKLNEKQDIQAGKYALSAAMTTPELLNMLNKGKVINESRTLTIPEGYNIKQIAERLEAENFCSAEEFLTYCETAVPSFISAEGVPENVKWAMEGFLFPDTYQIAEGATVEDIVDKLYKQFYKVLTEEKKAANYKGDMTDYEIMTLASIIEEEALYDEDRPLISGVFHNRIKDGMKLQSCVTVMYSLGEHRQKLYYKDLEIDDPYNTYMYADLPPGPISSPGRLAIRAALQPEETEYFYFFSTDDGKMIYSRTNREHNKNLEEYRKFS